MAERGSKHFSAEPLGFADPTPSNTNDLRRQDFIIGDNLDHLTRRSRFV